MDAQAQAAYQQVQDLIGKLSEPLKGPVYYEFLEEVSGHLESLMDCYREEHPEEFE